MHACSISHISTKQSSILSNNNNNTPIKERLFHFVVSRNMKFSVSNAAAAAFFLLAGGPLASAQGGVMQPAPFEITGFFAGTVPHSSQN